MRALASLLIVTIVVFGLARITGNPADTLLPIDIIPAERAKYIERLGLDRPIAEQYFVYMRGLVTGDAGISLRSQRPVTELVWGPVRNSLTLATTALVLMLLASVPLGVAAAVYRDRWYGKLAGRSAALGQSMPSFFSGVVAILIFSSVLGWSPAQGMGDWRHFILPAVTLGWFTSAGVVRLLRSSFLDVLDTEYVKLVRAKGVPESQVVWKHAFRNALIPSITFLGFMFGVMITVSIATEVVFAWPGVGRLAYDSLLTRDYPVLQFTVLIFTIIIITLNLMVDLLYAVVDPRTRV